MHSKVWSSKTLMRLHCSQISQINNFLKVLMFLTGALLTQSAFKSGWLPLQKGFPWQCRHDGCFTLYKGIPFPFRLWLGWYITFCRGLDSAGLSVGSTQHWERTSTSFVCTSLMSRDSLAEKLDWIFFEGQYYPIAFMQLTHAALLIYIHRSPFFHITVVKKP